MLSLSRAFLVSSLATALVASAAHANDTVMGGHGANLVPMQASDVVMESEDIDLTFREGRWYVVAHYRFHNPSAKAVTLQLGFPEYRCESEESDCASDSEFRFAEMVTRVRGVAVEHRKGKVKKSHPWAPRLGGVWLYDVSFGADEHVPIEHQYSVPSGYDVEGGRFATYVTRTGALWAKPIGQARFTFHLPARSSVDEPENLQRKSYRIVAGEGGEPTAELVYEVRDWKPEDDVSLYFNPTVQWGRDAAFPGDRKGCVLHDELRRAVYPQNMYSADSFEPLERGVVLGQLAQRTDEELRLCKNLPFAIYGRRFSDDALNRAFYGPQGFVPSDGPMRPYQPNPFFSDKLLTREDWAWVKLVDEALKAPRAPTSAAEPATEPPEQTASNAPSADRVTAPEKEQSVRSGGCGCQLASDHGSLRHVALSLTVAAWFAVRRRRGARHHG